MKKLLVCLFVVVLSISSVAYETQLGDTGAVRMMNDSSPSYSLKILDDGFAGYAAGTILPSFCLERSENFAGGTNYYGVLSNGAIYGGRDWKDGVFGQGPTSFGGGIDPIDERTAYLYTQFYNDYSGGNQAKWNENALQEAFHYIEAEQNWMRISGTAKRYVTLADKAVENGLWSGIGNVRSITLWASEQEVGDWQARIQDQLIMISTVPAPGALLMAGLGTVLVGFIRRRGRA